VPQVYRSLALVVGLAALAASGSSFAQRAQGHVQEVTGNVTGQGSTGRLRGLGTGQALPHNATVTTGPQSHAVLRFDDGMAVLLKENTSFQVQNYTYNPNAPETANATFHLLRGGLRILTGEMISRNRDTLRVGTPLATIGIRSTEFVAELTNSLFVRVIRGVITVTNSAGTVQFRVGEDGAVTSSSTLGRLISMNQIPPGVFQMPNVSLTPVSGKILPKH